MRTINLKPALSLFIAGIAMLATGYSHAAPVLIDIDTLEERIGDKLFVQDELATANYQRLDNAFRKGGLDEIKLNVYQLEAPAKDPVQYVRERAAQLDIKSKQIIFPDGDKLTEKNLRRLPPETTGLGMIDDKYEFAYNRINGTELLIDRERFHVGEGVDQEKIQPDKFYLQQADGYLKKRLEKNTAGMRLYGYKMRRYMDALAKEEGGEPQITVSQIAVAYNTAIDGIAVIGPGSKVSVHMTPEGEVISHETTLRHTAKRVAAISAKDLLAPEAGRKAVEERLRKRGVSLDGYTLARAEFGYYRRGRSSAQEIMAPYYAYFYLPKSEDQYARKLVELVPAVSNSKLLAMINKDEQQELARKKLLIGSAAKDDARRALPKDIKLRAPTDLKMRPQ